MSDPADVQRLIGDIIRFGTIASVVRANATCTVETGGLVSPEIPWIAQRAGGTTSWSPPTVGEQCLVFCPEGDLASGVAMLGLYSDANPAPASADKLDVMRYADGAEVSYDAAAHRLVAKLPAGGRAVIEAPDGIWLKGPLVVEGTLSVTGDADFAADVDVDGTLDATADVVGGGKSLKSHRHTGVQTGGGQSGPPA